MNFLTRAIVCGKSFVCTNYHMLNILFITMSEHIFVAYLSLVRASIFKFFDWPTYGGPYSGLGIQKSI